MLLLKGGGVLHIVLTAPPVSQICVLLTHLFDVIDECGYIRHAYADDTQVYISTRADHSDATDLSATACRQTCNKSIISQVRVQVQVQVQVLCPQVQVHLQLGSKLLIYTVFQKT